MSLFGQSLDKTSDEKKNVPIFTSAFAPAVTVAAKAKEHTTMTNGGAGGSSQERPLSSSFFEFGGQDSTGKLKRPLREVQFTDENKDQLMSKIRIHRPARVLLLGPVGSGKSSFISSVHSVFSGRVLNRAMVGSYTTSFTKKLQSFTGPPSLTMCDVMAVGEGEGTGISFHDILAVIKGHAPEGHKFSASRPLHPDCPGYKKVPGVKDRVDCVVFVLEAPQLASYCRGLRGTIQKLREHISDLGVHQVGLLTHIDKACAMTSSDVKNVYRSPTIQQMMFNTADMLGMPTSSIMPVKNYWSELDLDRDTDVLLLSAVELIQQYAGLYLQEPETLPLVSLSSECDSPLPSPRETPPPSPPETPPPQLRSRHL